MRNTVLAALVVIIGFTAPIIWDRYMSAAPELLFRALFFLTILSGLAWAALSDPVHARLTSARDYPVSSTLLAALLAAALVAAAWWLFVVAQKEDTRTVGFMAIAHDVDMLPGSTLAGIPWSQKFLELRVYAFNPTKHVFEDVDFLLKPDLPVAEVAQLDGQPPVSFVVHRNFTMNPEVVDHATGKRTRLPMRLIASSAGYHMRATRWPARTGLNIVMAIAVPTPDLKPGPGEPRQDHNRREFRLHANMSDGDQYWFGYGFDPQGNRIEEVFAARQIPTKVRVEGFYSKNGRRIEVKAYEVQIRGGSETNALLDQLIGRGRRMSA